MMIKPILVSLGLGIAMAGTPNARAATVGITSMKELADYAAKSGNTVRMKPGVYQLGDLLTEEVIAERTKEARKKKDAALFEFSGRSNIFDLTGVTIEVDTRLLSAFKGCYIREFLITGNRNTIRGLTVTDIGDQPTDRGGNSLSVHGDNNTLENLTLNIRGSFPYGYGDLLGKGSKNIVQGRKHSGLLICGTNTRLLGCKVITRAFGHAFFIQGGINTYFENCYAEGEMRPTDEMLAETEGPAFENDFASVYRPNVIQPGYMKSLNECGFRTYGSGGPEKRKTGKVTLVNCTAKNVRVGFALSANEKTDPVDLKNCTAIGCERGFYLTKTVAKACRGDAQYGPLLYLTGEEESAIELELLPETSEMTVHAVATLSGEGHEITLTGSRDLKHPIMLGYNPPGGGEISAPISSAAAEKVTLINLTDMPVVVSSEARRCTLTTKGTVERNEGYKIKVIQK